MAKSDPIQTLRREPTDTYGCPHKYNLQLNYDRWAFANRITPIGSSRAQLFQGIADTFVPKRFEWHSWTNRIVETLCKRRWSGYSGCSGCVAGGTRLPNPISGQQPTIQELCEKQIAPIVMTLHGPRQAGVPFVKGVAELIEVRLSNGSKFLATSDHVLLDAAHWCRVGDLRVGQLLFSYEPIHLGSTLGLDQSIRASNVQSSQRTVAGFQSGYPSSFRCDGVQLHSAIKAAQSTPPLRDDVPTHNHGCSHLDYLASKVSRILLQKSCRLSKKDFSHHHNFSRNHALLQRHQEIPSPEHQWFQPFSQCRLRTRSLRPFLIPSPDACCRHLAYNSWDAEDLLHPKTALPILHLSEFPPPSFDKKYLRETSSPVFLDREHKDSESSSIGLSALAIKVSQAAVVSIRSIGIRKFYDISVPGPQHYFAEGAIHHNSAKTWNITNFACAWWLCAPEESSVIIVSTTMKMLRKRAWAEVSSFYSAFCKASGIEEYGNYVDSQTLWRYQHGDDKHAIFGLAVNEGNTAKVADNIKGIHTKRQLVFIDEATAVPAAIWDACTNLYGYPIDAGGEFVLAASGNARSRLDAFGRFIEPESGWDSVSTETDDWEGRPRSEDGKRALIIRFDFRRSPNITEGKKVSKFLPTAQRVNARLKALEAKGALNDPLHYSNDLGFPPPEGIAKTVFTETLLRKFDAYGRHTFNGQNFRIIGAYDQARTGDRPALRFGALGEIKPGIMGLEWLPAIILYFDAKSKEPIAYQALRMVKERCANVEYRNQKYQCKPEDFGIDASNEASFCDICQREWSEDIIRVQFGGASSEDPCSHEDPRPANQVYKNKRAEMFFRSRSAVESGQLKGMDLDTAAELTTMEWSDTRPDGTGKLITLMDKSEYRKKFGASCDLSDSGVILSEVARLKGFRLAATGQTIHRSQHFDKIAELAQSVYHDISYSADNDVIEDDDGVEAM